MDIIEKAYRDGYNQGSENTYQTEHNPVTIEDGENDGWRGWVKTNKDAMIQLSSNAGLANGREPGESAGLKNMGWVSVKEKLPEEDGIYLIFAPNFIFAPNADEREPMKQCAWYNSNGMGWSLLPEAWIKAITHWRQLPEDPVGGF